MFVVLFVAILSWQDGEVVDYTWTRVKTNKNYLKVKRKSNNFANLSVFPILFAVARREAGGHRRFLLQGCERLWIGEGQG